MSIFKLILSSCVYWSNEWPQDHVWVDLTPSAARTAGEEQLGALHTQ